MTFPTTCRNFVLTACLLALPLSAGAACVDISKPIASLHEVQILLHCLEKKIDESANKAGGEVVMVNYLPELPKPTISKKGYIGDIMIGLKSCNRRGTNIRCSFSLRNEAKDKELVVYQGSNDTFVFDEFGKKSVLAHVNISGVKTAKKMLITKVPVEMTLTFNDVDEKVTTFTRFDLNTGKGRLNLRNIVIR